MPRLCKELHSMLNDDNLKKLNARKIYTVVDFLDENPIKVAEFTKIPYKDISDLRKFFINHFLTFPQNALETYKDMVENTAIISSHIPRFDALLNGGLMTGELLEIFGTSGTGKSQLCMTLAANVALYLKKQVFYIDCKNDFSGTRLHSILQAQSIRDEELGMAMDRVKVIRPTSVYQLLLTLPDLHQQILKEQDSNSRFPLLVVDSLCTLFYPFLGETSKVFGMLHCLGVALRQMACELHLPVILVNLAKNWQEEDEELAEQPAFGKVWSSFPNTRLHITRMEESVSVRIRITKSTRLPCDHSCLLQISSKGIE